MNLGQRFAAMTELGHYLRSEDAGWQEAKQQAYLENPWFTPAFTQLAIHNLQPLLQPENLQAWAASYKLPAENAHPRLVGLVMAGNIPLVGFHDFLCLFISGHRQVIKPSSRDQALIRHLAGRLSQIDPRSRDLISFAERLNGCEAFIATGSNNSARYFEYYFGKYPHIIRRNRTSVAVLTGHETKEELGGLADDICQYFGLGCRNVTKVYTPEGYSFEPLLKALSKYEHLSTLHKYKNNYDYQLALQILNKQPYMTNGTLLLVEAPSLFSPISVLHYETYRNLDDILLALKSSPDVQCIVGQGHTPFGQAQQPGLWDYADGVDTMEFLRNSL